MELPSVRTSRFSSVYLHLRFRRVAAGPQIVERFTLLPNFLFHKRQLLQYLIFREFQLYLQGMFFPASEKRLLFCSEPPYHCASPSTYQNQNLQFLKHIKTIFYKRIFYRLRVSVVEEREAKRRDVKGVRGPNLLVAIFLSAVCLPRIAIQLSCKCKRGGL